MSVFDRLRCPRCASTSLDTTCLERTDAWTVEGHARCTACDFELQAHDGVIEALVDTSMTPADHTMRRTYTDVWERGAEVLDAHSYTGDLDLLERWRHRFAGRPVLDAGCGSGRMGSTWCALGASAVVFVDLSDAIHACRRRFLELPEPRPEALFLKASIKALPLVDDCADVVFCSDVLTSVDEQLVALAELFRAARSSVVLTLLGDRAWAARTYVALNAVRPLVRAVGRPDIVYGLAGGVARLAYGVLWLWDRSGLAARSSLRTEVRAILEDERAFARLRVGFYDTLVTPPARRLADAAYLGVAREAGFDVVDRCATSFRDYFDFERDADPGRD